MRMKDWRAIFKLAPVVDCLDTVPFEVKKVRKFNKRYLLLEAVELGSPYGAYVLYDKKKNQFVKPTAFRLLKDLKSTAYDIIRIYEIEENKKEKYENK